MAHVITGGCCADASCVDVCPVDCIHPTPAERGFLDADMLFINPDSCIDCGMCVPECPVDAIRPDHELTSALLPFLGLAEAHFRGGASKPLAITPPTNVRRELRVAIVGAGAAGGYAARELLKIPGVRLDVYERGLTPYGLVRNGIAPDHPLTKQVEKVLPFVTGDPNLRLHLGVEVGRHISRAELLQFHHAVVFAAGADREEPLAGCVAAGEFVGWYNGDPRYAARTFDLSHERVVVIGNGNVALDVARVLTGDVALLARTDIADHALEALRASQVREVVVVGRRGVAEAAYSHSELLALLHRDDIEVVFDPTDLERDEAMRPTVSLPAGPAGDEGDRKRIVLRYLLSPELITPGEITLVENELAGARAVPTSRRQKLPAGLVLSSIGYRVGNVGDLPIEADGRSVRHRAGRVLPGTYVTGWLKRGPRGVVGSNKACAIETVGSLLADFDSGQLAPPPGSEAGLDALLDERYPDRLDAAAWNRIDAAERRSGAASGRPRRKLTSDAEIRAAAR
jgi:ferredoxin--NADP+ reductase